jgi:hypothetical protein
LARGTTQGSLPVVDAYVEECVMETKKPTTEHSSLVALFVCLVIANGFFLLEMANYVW